MWRGTFTFGPEHVKWANVIWMTFDMWADESAKAMAYRSCAPEDAKPGTSVVISGTIISTDESRKVHQIKVIGYAEQKLGAA